MKSLVALETYVPEEEEQSSRDQFYFTDWDSVEAKVLGSVPDDITGSAILLTLTRVIDETRTEVRKILIDAGSHQGGKHDNWKHIEGISAEGIDVVTITHPHVDHIALAPRLTRNEKTEHIFLPKSTEQSAKIALRDVLRVVTSLVSPDVKYVSGQLQEQLSIIDKAQNLFRARSRKRWGKTRTDHKSAPVQARSEISRIEGLLRDAHGGEKVDGKWTFPKGKTKQKTRKARDTLITELHKAMAVGQPATYTTDFIDTGLSEFCARMEAYGMPLSEVLEEYNSIYNRRFIKSGDEQDLIQDIPIGNSRDDIRARQQIFEIYQRMSHIRHQRLVGMIEHDALINSADLRKFDEVASYIQEGEVQQLPHEIGTIRFDPTGHLEFGSSSVQLTLKVGGKIRRILFTGDIGRSDLPTKMPVPGKPKSMNMYPTRTIPSDKSDVIFQEATYGALEEHTPYEESREQLFRTIDEAIAKGGHVFMPILSQDRPFRIAQDILLAIQKGRLDPNTFHLCFAGGYTLLARYLNLHLHGPEGRAVRAIFHGATDQDFHAMSEPSDPSNPHKRCRIFLASGGFLPNKSTANRLLHKLVNRTRSTLIKLVSTSYHGAPGSVGYRCFHERVLEGQFGEEVELPDNFQPVIIDGFSGHEAQRGLVQYNLQARAEGSTTFLVHGDTDPREALKKELEAQGSRTVLPERGKSILLFQE